MYIRKVTKQNNNSAKQYFEYRLVKSSRHGTKVSQSIMITMPDIRLPKELWKQLASSIEAKLNGQDVLYQDKVVAAETERWLNCIQTKLSRTAPPVVTRAKASDDYEAVSLSSIANHHPQSIGAEHIAYSMYQELGFDGIFSELGLNEKQRHEAALSILGRMLEPGSEHATAGWARMHTGLGELLGTSFAKLSHNALYRITDRIYQHQEHLENSLRERERSIFHLQENIFLYDLTNTYLEGMGQEIPKAKFGRSKEKRYDCRLLTMGLVLDELGFPKRSRVLEGSVSEPTTLRQMLDCLTDDSSGKSPIVVIDAGIAASDNLEYLRQAGYDYICVARNQPIPQELIEADQLIDIRNKGNNPIRVQMFAQDRENILFCHSARMEDKERAMQAKFCARFEAELKHLNDMLSSRHGRKKYSYVQDQVSRLKERYKSVSRFYEIAVSRKEDTATEISIVCSRQAELDDKYSGSYFLRTSLMDLDEQKIWELYMMLNTVESAFRTLKSELDFRPVYHQKERRAEAHLFIAVLAYHIVNAIQHRLQESGIRLSWSTLRKMMRNHQIVLTTMQTKDGWLISILDSTIPEDNHLQIYNALGIGSRPIKRKLTKSKVV